LRNGRTGKFFLNKPLDFHPASTIDTYGDTALSTGETYTYDANGNIITRVEGGLTYTQTFDAENRLISVTVSGQTTQFIYDGDGNLVKKVKPDNSKTIYVGGIYEVDKTAGGSVTRTVTYYPVAGAMRINSTLYYTLKDHLGSASVVTDASGNILGENRYYPYGETRLTTGTIFTDKLFTGQREMRRPEPVEGAGLGIYHYNARFYSPKLGRFLSADTIVPGAANPQAYNRYSYVLGNPLKYTDPTGHYCVGDDEDCADEGGDGPASTGAGGNNGNGGSGGGNPHDDDDVDPNPSGYISSIQIAISYLQYSLLGTASYNLLILQGYTITYSNDGAGHVDGTLILVPLNASPTYIAGTIAHEAAHISIHANGTLLEEYQAMLAGDIVRNDLIQTGHGTSSDMRHPLSSFTVDINNPNRIQLTKDLNKWFQTHEKLYTMAPPKGYCVCPALPRPPHTH
jgi:RHS repeat-associated protein